MSVPFWTADWSVSFFFNNKKISVSPFSVVRGRSLVKHKLEEKLSQKTSQEGEQATLSYRVERKGTDIDIIFFRSVSCILPRVYVTKTVTCFFFFLFLCFVLVSFLFWDLRVRIFKRKSTKFFVRSCGHFVQETRVSFCTTKCAGHFVFASPYIS